MSWLLESGTDARPVLRGLSMTVGESYRVKHTAVLRKYGVRVGGRFVAKGDEVAWPSDIGTVTDSSYVHQPSGERVAYYTLAFSRGRRLVLDVTDDGRIVWPGRGERVADFVRVARPRVRGVED